MAQFASLEHALALFSSCAEFSAFIAAFRPPVASLLAGNGAANAAVANALSRRHAAFNFFVRMGTGTRHAAPPRGRGASDGARRELPPPRPIDRYGRRRYRPAECESASVGRRRRLGSGGRGSWLQTFNFGRAGSTNCPSYQRISQKCHTGFSLNTRRRRRVSDRSDVSVLFFHAFLDLPQLH